MFEHKFKAWHIRYFNLMIVSIVIDKYIRNTIRHRQKEITVQNRKEKKNETKDNYGRKPQKNNSYSRLRL